MIGAVLVAGGRAPVVVTEDMVAAMKPGAVIVDVAVDQGGCVETTHETTHDDPVYEVHGVLHYAVGNIPGAVPNTSTYALTNATLPYLVELAERGRPPAVAPRPGAGARRQHPRRRGHPPRGGRSPRPGAGRRDRCTDPLNDLDPRVKAGAPGRLRSPIVSEASATEDLDVRRRGGRRGRAARRRPHLHPGHRPGGLLAPTFRTVYLGAFASNIGTWMQNVVLGRLRLRPHRLGRLRRRSSLFAQLGPLLLFSLVGGVLADTFDRRRLLIVAQRRAGRCFSLAARPWSCPATTRPRPLLVGVVFVIGIGNALYAPALSAVLPSSSAARTWPAPSR